MIGLVDMTSDKYINISDILKVHFDSDMLIHCFVDISSVGFIGGGFLLDMTSDIYTKTFQLQKTFFALLNDGDGIYDKFSGEGFSYPKTNVHSHNNVANVNNVIYIPLLWCL